MAYPIEVVKLPAQPALVVRTRVRQADLGAELRSILPEVFQFALAQQAGVAGMPFTRYISTLGEVMEIEAGMPVTKRVPVGGRITLIELPAGPALVTTHFGPYEGLPAARDAVKAWMREKGKAASDAMWEEYLTDAAEEPNPEKWETRICQPIF